MISTATSIDGNHSGQSSGIVQGAVRGGEGWRKPPQWTHLFILGSNQSTNFQARYPHENIKRGIVNIHVNIRSLYNKVTEVKD